MGVRGLTGFIDANPQFVEECCLYNCTLVIDGNSHLYHLYASSHADFIHGGDYLRFASHVKSFYGLLKKCNIIPIVVFDGGYDKQDGKLNTLVERAKHRISIARVIAKYGTSPDNLLPLLAKETFETTLRELNITMVKSSFEADHEITSIANVLGCPVVSNDSDFYIYNLPNGFVHMNTIDPHVRSKACGNSSYFYLQAKIYYLDQFLYFFQGLNISLLPLFATLAGNDMMDSQHLVNFYNSIPLPKNRSRKVQYNKQHCRLIGLLEWLKNYDLDDAISYVLRTLKKEFRERIHSKILKSIENYNTHSTYLLYYIDTQHVWEPNSLIASLNEKNLPTWFSEKFHQNLLSSLFVNTICSHRNFFLAQVEDFEEVSAYNCALHLRQKMYGIILQYDYPDYYKVPKETVMIEEYSRKGTHIYKYNISPIFDFESSPHLEDIPSLTHNQKCSYFAKILEIDNNILKEIPEPYVVFAGSLLYSIHYSAPKITLYYVGALLLCVIYFSIVLPLLEKGRRHPEIVRPFASFRGRIPSLTHLLSNIGKNEARLAKKNLEKYTHLHSNSRRFDVIPVHLFSQFQASILAAIQVNRLLACPYPDPHVPNLLNGPFIYNIYRDLITRTNIEHFMAILLGPDTWLASFCINFFSLFQKQNMPNTSSQVKGQRPKYKIKR